MKTALAFFALSASMAAAQTFPDDLVERGRYVATASDCVACHTGPEDKPFGGNHRIASPVGDIWAGNITPSTTHGIGNYTEQQFADAVRRGIRADGANLYPAMPYTAFAKITDEDIHALYAYFMQGVAPIDEPSQQTTLEFPFNLRFSMIGWNLMFRDTAVHRDDPAKSAEWNRGAYLAEGPGHCSTCHTPRGMLMQEDGSLHLAGAQVGPWFAPNITSDKDAGIGSWQKDEIVAYLATGRAEGKSQAGGSMAEAVSHSFSKLTKDDLGAIATYIMDVPAIGGPARFGQGEAGNLTASFRGIESPDLSDPGKGAQIYSANCASCHGYDGQGTQDQYYPSLFHNSDTSGAGVNNFVAAVLNGVDRKTEEGHVFMPPFGTQPNAFNSLDDGQIALLANYAVAQFGDGQMTVAAEDVAMIRAGGPTSNMVRNVRILMAAAGVLVLIGTVVFLRRRKTA
ncbi:cytochrome c [Falsirhodobacter xinxiangensis]|uniref:cytochrome c n=1 Tax=Falsirhodobacter xinxiangensis TaxID=2530049 RepID=UPI001C706EF0|nr:cytochrome c [Rhodobacter xinxiangensis]